jgi:hypothetical protein
LFITQRDEDADVFPVHTACDKSKTAAGQTMIAKVKRLIKGANPETRKPPKMKSRPFQRVLTKGFDGKVRRR